MGLSFTLGELGERINAELLGDPSVVIDGLATIQSAAPGQLCFLANTRYLRYLPTAQASAVLLKPSMVEECGAYSGAFLLLDNPYLGFAYLTDLFVPQPKECDIHPTAVIDSSAILGRDVTVAANVVIEAGVELQDRVSIGAGCYIGSNSVVGEQTRLQPNVSIYHGVTIGSQCLLHSGVVVGSDGFGFASEQGAWKKIHQLGGVHIGDRVELGAGTTVDRGALDDTIIGDGVKIDNQVQIAHNVSIGANTAIAACSAIAGSTSVGENCTLAGAVGVVGHLTIADNVHITAMTLVTKSIRQAGSYSSGTPLMASRHWRRNAVRFGQLDQLATTVKQLKKPQSD